MKVLSPPSVGSSGALSWQRSRAGQTVRSRRKPVRPTVLAGSDSASARLGRVARKWATLTDEQREAWRSEVQGRSTTDGLGQASQLSAFNFFVRIALRYALVGYTLPTKPPGPGRAPTFKSWTLTATHGSPGTLSLAWTGASAGSRIAFYVSGPQSPGSVRPARMKFIYSQAYASGAGSQSLISGWVSKFGSLPQGSRVFWRVGAIGSTGHWAWVASGTSLVS